MSVRRVRPASHDWTFLHWYLIRFTGKSPFGHSGCLDMKTLYATKAGLPLRAVAKRTMPAEPAAVAPSHASRAGRRRRAGRVAREPHGVAGARVAPVSSSPASIGWVTSAALRPWPTWLKTRLSRTAARQPVEMPESRTIFAVSGKAW
ncbi:hypothetical protein QF030_006429 [Streptomyces rishiriensis]|uniref:Uncharacterized protein n=1 Tax=Streptomyces rishiriensis TaxID=68264 RepID=A0ABU0NYM8_STRRH|nr:hypothetical protein [Streptomyces rishiriensis]